MHRHLQKNTESTHVAPDSITHFSKLKRPSNFFRFSNASKGSIIPPIDADNPELNQRFMRLFELDSSIRKVTFQTENGKLLLQTAQAWDGPNTTVGAVEFDLQTIPPVNRGDEAQEIYLPKGQVVFPVPQDPSPAVRYLPGPMLESSKCNGKYRSLDGRVERDVTVALHPSYAEILGVMYHGPLELNIFEVDAG